MDRRPPRKSGISAKDLSKRLRKLRELDKDSPQSSILFNDILKDIRTLGDTQNFKEKVALKPNDLANLITTITAQPDLPSVNTLDFVTTTTMKTIRDKLPQALPQHPVSTGGKGAKLPIKSSAFNHLLRLAAIARSEGQKNIIWDDGINQLIIHAGTIKAVVTSGLIKVEITVSANKLNTTMHVPFAVGSERRVAGLVASTVSRPIGNVIVARVWGDSLIAFAYGSLMDTVGSLAAASGRDTQNNRLVPREITARRGQLIIESQARFRFKGQLQ